ncbi:MAG: SRPBCC family protein [Polaromonas sp.]|nr:SRPBCC family protein [Polaromonas sp.]
MESIASRSDSRSLLLDASTDQVFAAINDPERIARWWGPEGFTNTIHTFEFVEGGRWLLTMHGPDGKDYPNESRFARITPDKCVVIEHFSGHHFFLTLELDARGDSTLLKWQQTFDTREHYERIALFVAAANQQNLDRLSLEVQRGRSVPLLALP